MKKYILIVIILIFPIKFAVGQNDSLLISVLNSLHKKTDPKSLKSYTHIQEWGLVGYSDKFVTDETEILIEEWLEYIYYHDYEKIPTYINRGFVTEKNITPQEREILLSTQIDPALLPIKEVLNKSSESYIFTKCKNCGLMKVEGLHGKYLLPVDADSLKNKNSLTRLKYYLETPVTGISYEQALDFCKWRTIVDSLIVIEQKAENSPDMDKSSKLWTEYCRMRCFRYSLPTPEQFDKINFSLDSNSIRRHYISGFNYRNSKFSKRHKSSETNLRCGKMPVGAWKFYHPPHTFNGYNVMHTQGNVAEMTTVKGIARGGSYFHYAKDSYPGINNYYSKPEPWLGFRCVGIKYRVFNY